MLRISTGVLLMINSRQKGASFEREVAKALTAEGFAAKRGAQVSQGAWGVSAPDVIVPSSASATAAPAST